MYMHVYIYIYIYIYMYILTTRLGSLPRFPDYPLESETHTASRTGTVIFIFAMFALETPES